MPAIFADVEDRAAVDMQLTQEYKQAIVTMFMLMAQPGTALEELINSAEYNAFDDYESNVTQLAAELHRHFQELHPNMEPVCSACAGPTDQAEVCPNVVAFL